METDHGPSHRWTLRPVPDEALVTDLASALNDLPPALARSLALRGVAGLDDARTFFRAGVEALHDPFLMKDMDRAADRLAEAVARGERVLVYGDYDVDGTTSTALMTSFLQSLGVETDYFIPNRFDHGYGLCCEGLDHAKNIGAALVVALDCGITAHREAAYARELGVDLVICDHHTPDEQGAPDALAVLNPKRADCTYPFTELSGCGVGFKLLQAVLKRLGRDPSEAWPYLDLVAVSTASDIVALYGENRVLMREGMDRLRVTQRPGLKELARRANVDLATLSGSRIVFSIGPRINAAGRMADAMLAAALLLATTEEEARRLADELEALNDRRRQLDRATRAEAVVMARALIEEKDPLALVLHSPDWHPGVIGITASRIAEEFHRPAVMLASTNGRARGSARSAGGVNMYNALAACEDLLTRFGGHAFAAGLALPTENVPALQERLAEAVADAVDPEALVPELEIDADLDLAHIDGRFWSVLSQFAPHGPDNPKPLFRASGVRVVGPPGTVGKDGRHLRMRVAPPDGGAPLRTIGFGLGDRVETALTAARRGRPLEIVFNVEENHYKGQSSLQLRVKDLGLG